jgi:proline racemase
MKWARTVTAIGRHVGGGENDVIVGGVLPPPGATVSHLGHSADGRATRHAPW